MWESSRDGFFSFTNKRNCFIHQQKKTFRCQSSKKRKEIDKICVAQTLPIVYSVLYEQCKTMYLCLFWHVRCACVSCSKSMNQNRGTSTQISYQNLIYKPHVKLTKGHNYSKQKQRFWSGPPVCVTQRYFDHDGTGTKQFFSHFKDKYKGRRPKKRIFYGQADPKRLPPPPP